MSNQQVEILFVIKRSVQTSWIPSTQFKRSGQTTGQLNKKRCLIREIPDFTMLSNGTTCFSLTLFFGRNSGTWIVLRIAAIASGDWSYRTNPRIDHLKIISPEITLSSND